MRTLSSWRARSAFGVVVFFPPPPDAMGVSGSCGGQYCAHRAVLCSPEVQQLDLLIAQAANVRAKRFRSVTGHHLLWCDRTSPDVDNVPNAHPGLPRLKCLIGSADAWVHSVCVCNPSVAIAQHTCRAGMS